MTLIFCALAGAAPTVVISKTANKDVDAAAQV
jgi:hypothetical protein